MGPLWWFSSISLILEYEWLCLFVCFFICLILSWTLLCFLLCSSENVYFFKQVINAIFQNILHVQKQTHVNSVLSTMGNGWNFCLVFRALTRLPGFCPDIDSSRISQIFGQNLMLPSVTLSFPDEKEKRQLGSSLKLTGGTLCCWELARHSREAMVYHCWT